MVSDKPGALPAQPDAGAAEHVQGKQSDGETIQKLQTEPGVETSVIEREEHENKEATHHDTAEAEKAEDEDEEKAHKEEEGKEYEEKEEKEEEEEEEYEDEEAEEWKDLDLRELEEFSPYEVLKVPEKKPSVSKIQAAFHRYSTTSDTNLRFSKVVLAYLILKDAEKRRIYDECGWKMLRQSESYHEDNIFDQDPTQVFEDFFAGKTEQDRDYLLMNSGNDFSDSEEDNPNYIPIEEEIPVNAEELAANKKARLASMEKDDDVAEIDAILRRFQMTGQILPTTPKLDLLGTASSSTSAPCSAVPQQKKIASAASTGSLLTCSGSLLDAKLRAFQLDTTPAVVQNAAESDSESPSSRSREAAGKTTTAERKPLAREKDAEAEKETALSAEGLGIVSDAEKETALSAEGQEIGSEAEKETALSAEGQEIVSEAEKKTALSAEGQKIVSEAEKTAKPSAGKQKTRKRNSSWTSSRLSKLRRLQNAMGV